MSKRWSADTVAPASCRGYCLKIRPVCMYSVKSRLTWLPAGSWMARAWKTGFTAYQKAPIPCANACERSEQHGTRNGRALISSYITDRSLLNYPNRGHEKARQVLQHSRARFASRPPNSRLHNANAEIISPRGHHGHPTSKK